MTTDWHEYLSVSESEKIRQGDLIAFGDPNQGIFSTINSARSLGNGINSIFLQDVHRFQPALYRLIQHLYGQFPLNAVALRTAVGGSGGAIPSLMKAPTEDSAIELCVQNVQATCAQLSVDERLCVVVLSDLEDRLVSALEARLTASVVHFRSFDDIDLLTYQKRAVVVSSWQFIGGTQFSHVVVMSAGLASPNSVFANIRELTGIYIAASRATSQLLFIADLRIPTVLQDAITRNLLEQVSSAV